MLYARSLLRRAQFSIHNGGYVILRRYCIVQSSDEEDVGLKAGSAGQERHRYKKGRVFVSASEIANLINANPHVSVGDAVERLWERNNSRKFKEALDRNKLQSFTQEERLKELGVFELATSVIETEEPEEYEQQLRKTLRRATTIQDRTVIKDFINTSRGIKQEKTTFESLKQKHPSAKLNTDSNLYQKTISIPDAEIEYMISGYIDGVELNNQRIIEIKNRQSRLFNHVPLYEQVQCQAYLFLTGLAVCEHTESFRGIMQSTTLHYEPIFWNHVIERLNKVILAFDRLLKDTTVQDNFLQTRQLFVTAQESSAKKRSVNSSKRSKRSSIYEMKEAVEETNGNTEVLGK